MVKEDRRKALPRLVAAVFLIIALNVVEAEERPFAQLSRAELEFFEKKIRPVLSDRCYGCHSSHAEKVKGGLLLDSRERLLKGGDSGAVIVAGEPDNSRLIQAIRYTDKDLQMPPKEQLPPEQITDLETWVKMGAPDPRTQTPSILGNQLSVAAASTSWPFQSAIKPPVPRVKRKEWPSSAIDHFVLAKLEENRLSPAPPADKRTRIRRATFDLIGMPPKPEEIEGFLTDTSSDAFAKVVDRLLASRHFGERWGRHWLDVARYADSNGLEVNLNFENAWRYRDYVIAAFNRDKPFDQFIREQIAGDLLPAPSEEERIEHLIATGFLALGPKVLTEPDNTRLLMDVVDEQIDVTTRAFLGLTVSCARCHDHKYDPIPTRDYYSMAGIFKSTTTLAQQTREREFNKRWIEKPIGPPEMVKAFQTHEGAVTKLREQFQQARARKEALPGGVGSQTLPGIVVDNQAAELTGVWKASIYSTNRFVDQNYIQDGRTGKGKKSVRFVPNLPHAGQYEVRISYTPGENRTTNVPVTVHASTGAHLTTVDQTLEPPIDALFLSLGIFQFAEGTNAAVVISNEGTKEFVVADAAQFLPMDNRGMAMSKPAAADGKPQMVNGEMANPDLTKLFGELAELEANAPPAPPLAMAVQEGSVGDCRIHIRGDSQKLGDEVPRGFLTVISGPSPTSAQIPIDRSGRLELANWIANPDNPLTARVAVNRIWLHLFGKGLVGSPDNFGALGERPTHPELLDYLARRFVELGWSPKKLIREMMLSSAYQMSSVHNSADHAVDPENQLLWRMNRRRLEAEAIRDAVLQVSGRLDPTAGGPPLASDNEIARQTNPIRMNPGPSAPNRRSIYLPVLRNDVLDMFQLFDFVDPHVLSGKRNITTAPTQALFIMNSPFMQEQSEQAARALLELSAADDAQRVKAAYLGAFGRPPTAKEAERSLRYLEGYASALEKTETEPGKRKLRTWQSFCHALFGTTEFRFVN
jgi:hypothetical protein